MVSSTADRSERGDSSAPSSSRASTGTASSTVSGPDGTAGAPPAAPGAGTAKRAGPVLTPRERRRMRMHTSPNYRRTNPSFFSWSHGWGKVIALVIVLVVLCVVLGVLCFLSYKIIMDPRRQKVIMKAFKPAGSRIRVTAASE
ncbi:hypothetical protein V5799_016904 [Amblyomma americanum]|uniref:Uncharacterized protein n=1 Tax=Amblyomma americanum TaxID=6943 RepID=A0AAQ4F3T0_AMBAM